MIRHTAKPASWVLPVLLVLGGAGCRKDAPESYVVVYTSVDEVFAREVLSRFEERTGRKLAIVFDSEAGKTTGLVQKLRTEAQRPRADVFWSSEIFNTILLAREGLLEAYDSPAAADIPPRYRDDEHRWTATSVRARVLAFDTKTATAVRTADPTAVHTADPAAVHSADPTAVHTADPAAVHTADPAAVYSADPTADPAAVRTADPTAGGLPERWEELGEPRFARGLAYANPLFGTTRGHVAAMFALWGEERGRAFLVGLKGGGAMMLDGNSTVVRAVMDGRARFCATDSDDVLVARRQAPSLEMLYPDLGDGGTLLIPCTVAIVRGGPNLDGARALVDFLVSPEVERMLARSDSGNIPVRASLREELGLHLPPETKLSFDAVADAMPAAVAAVEDVLIR
jgi:ABC-type Fe3+ transport system substrate-binding protein